MYSDKPLTKQERQYLNEEFSRVIGLMKKSGTPDVLKVKQAFEYWVSLLNGDETTLRRVNIYHPLDVAKIIAENQNDSDMISAALLLDAVEKFSISKEKLSDVFGAEIAEIAYTAVCLESVAFDPENERHYKAAYIKCADRINSFRKRDDLPAEKVRELSYHARRTLIPVAKTMHVDNFVKEMEDSCLQIEDPDRYEEIRREYEQVLAENKYTFFGPFGLEHSVEDIVKEVNPISEISFYKRNLDEINREISSRITNLEDFNQEFQKGDTPLFDVFVTISEEYRENDASAAEELFFRYYDKIHGTSFRFTIFNIVNDSYKSYYLVKDRFNHIYRFYTMFEKDEYHFRHGDEIVSGYMPSDTEVGSGEIHVFKKDGSLITLPDGYTALDLAFRIDRNIGLCATHAYVNNDTSHTPLYYKLKDGDKIEIVSEHYKNDPARDVPHATLRWFRYLNDKNAIIALADYLEKHGNDKEKIRVTNGQGKEFQIEKGSTIVDFAFEVNAEYGLNLKTAFVNGNETELDKVICEGDKVVLKYNMDETTAELNWLAFAQNDKTKQALIRYFEQSRTKKSGKLNLKRTVKGKK